MKKLIENRRKQNEEFIERLAQDENIDIETFRVIVEELNEHDRFVNELIDRSYHGKNFNEN